jgi:RHS repeat-associated protein
VDYDYIGPGRVLERTYANGVRLTYLDDARQKDVGYDGLKRVVLHRHLRQDNSLVAGFAYDYDRANNKLFEIKQHDNNRREDYTYDSIYRLVRFARQGESEDTWQLDGANNWVSRKGVANQANNMNEYTSFAGAPQLHDDNGNLVDDGTNRYQYDFANRLRKVIRKSDNAVIAVYRYDAYGRRNERIVTNTAIFDDQVRYIYDRWHEIEEQRVGSTQQYVYGRWIDELLTLDKDTNNDGAIDQSFFYHQDAKTHVTAVTDSSAGVVEQVTNDPYGRPSLLESKVGNSYLFTGRRLDGETGLYYYRARYYNPQTGRFRQRDPLGILSMFERARMTIRQFRQRDPLGIYGVASLNNGYTYVANNPVNLVDPLGMQQGTQDDVLVGARGEVEAEKVKGEAGARVKISGSAGSAEVKGPYVCGEAGAGGVKAEATLAGVEIKNDIVGVGLKCFTAEAEGVVGETGVFASVGGSVIEFSAQLSGVGVQVRYGVKVGLTLNDKEGLKVDAGPVSVSVNPAKICRDISRGIESLGRWIGLW